MKNKETEKAQLLDTCLRLVNKKLSEVEKQMQSLQNDLLTATKSSTGDKHETSRAMIQLEMEKLSQQLLNAKHMYNTLNNIKVKSNSAKVKLGSVVKTTVGTYFIAVSLGVIKVDTQEYLVVSAKSPIGLALLGKSVGDIIPFNNATILKIY